MAGGARGEEQAQSEGGVRSKMSIPPDSPGRSCAACYRQPVGPDEVDEARALEQRVDRYNCRIRNAPLAGAEIVYRNSGREHDVLHHVFRWDTTPYQEAFQNGFQARRQEDTADEVYYDLPQHVLGGGRPLDSRRRTTHVFISTTRNSEWHPTLDPGHESLLYRYEIYAPGGIHVAPTLGDRYQEYRRQDEVAFVAGIAPQYIRSAQYFRLIADDSGNTHRYRVNNILRFNAYFNPQQYPYRPLNIQRPVDYYYVTDEDGTRTRRDLLIRYFPEEDIHERKKRQVSTAAVSDAAAAGWYAVDVANTETYINAAFRSSRTNEAYLFMKNEYVLLNYAPGTTGDRVLNGPLFICDGYPSLTGTAFGEDGIDSAFGSHDGNEAFVFSGNLCAHIDYAPGTTDDRIIRGPTTIAAMFPFFRGTVFESGIDAAFEATAKYEAYLFKGNRYALINYRPSRSYLIADRLITQGFGSLRNTIFESGIDAAFASHRTDEAYLFKGNSYALINFAPGTTDDYIIGGVKQIRPNWPSLRDILPRKNHGLDVHDHADPHHGHDEL